MGKKSLRQPRAATTGKHVPTDNDGVEAQLQHLKLDPRGDGMYSGTFRWLESKQFPRLPPFPVDNTKKSKALVDFFGDWKAYLSSRSSSKADGDLVSIATQDPSLLDALSFPVTFLHVTQLLELSIGPHLNVLVIGASQKAEQRVWRITDYWNEIALFYASSKAILFFIGPEVDENDVEHKTRLPSNMEVRHFRGTFSEFQDSQFFSDCTPDTSVVVGYNTGFGNFVETQRHELLFSWLPDLYRIADSNIPAIFTCANDYADMNGEFAVQSRVIGAKMLLLPMQNPFSAASHLHEEGQRDTAWSRSSSFLYVVCGVDKARRVEINGGDLNTLQQRLDADLYIHLCDKLGRHFYKGMVLTKEQASRCKALNGNQSHISESKSSASLANGLETPRLELMPGRQDSEVIAVILMPKILSPSEQIAVDISESVLTVFVPGKYFLKTRLPFDVSKDPGTLKAQLTLPFLRVSIRKK